MGDQIHKCVYCLDLVYLPECIYPCKCKLPKHIHCFKKWLRVCPINTRTRCEICKSKYNYIIKSGANNNRETGYCICKRIIIHNYDNLSDLQRNVMFYLYGLIPFFVFVGILLFGKEDQQELVIIYALASDLIYTIFVCTVLYLINCRYRWRVVPLLPVLSN